MFYANADTIKLLFNCIINLRRCGPRHSPLRLKTRKMTFAKAVVHRWGLYQILVDFYLILCIDSLHNLSHLSDYLAQNLSCKHKHVIVAPQARF